MVEESALRDADNWSPIAPGMSLNRTALASNIGLEANVRRTTWPGCCVPSTVNPITPILGSPSANATDDRCGPLVCPACRGKATAIMTDSHW